MLLITFYREIYEAKVGTFGLYMKMIEVVGCMLYITMIIHLLAWCSIYLGFKDIAQDPYCLDLFQVTELPPCLSNLDNQRAWLGRSIEWFVIEIFVFLFYTLTMLILMAKSRFATIGMDQSGQFEPYYLQRVVNQIISNIPFERYSKKEKFV